MVTSVITNLKVTMAKFHLYKAKLIKRKKMQWVKPKCVADSLIKRKFYKVRVPKETTYLETCMSLMLVTF